MLRGENLKLQTTTDYAIRVMSFLFLEKNTVTAQELSEKLSISRQYLYKILRQLRESGMVDVEQGRWGGYRIAEGMRNATLYDIVRCMEGDIQINACLGPDGYCNRNGIGTCPVHSVLEGAQKQLIESLSRVNLSDIQIMGSAEREVGV